MMRYFTWKAFGFWNVTSLITDGLLVSAFVLRVTGLSVNNLDRSADLKLRSFQILSCVAPFIWYVAVSRVKLMRD